MARHRRHRRHFRGLGDIVSVPALGKLNPKKLLGAVNPIGKTVKSTDVLIGVAVATAGAGLIKKYALDKWTSKPAFVAEYEPVVIGLIAAVGLSFAFKKKAAKAQGLAFGALCAGLVPLIMNKVQSFMPASLSGMTNLDLGGFLVSDADRALRGFLVSDSMQGLAEAPHMAELAQHATSADEDDVIALREMSPSY